MSTLTKKVFKDITHRKVRTILTIIGIAIGIIGLSAVNIASSYVRSSLAYASNVSEQPDVQIFTKPTSPDLTTTLAQQPNVKQVQARGNLVTRWAVGKDHKLLKVQGILDFQNLKISKFQLVEGSLPGSNEIVLEAGTHSLVDVHVGDSISIQTGTTYRQVRVSGFVQTQGRALASIDGIGWGYMNEQDFEKLFNRSGVTDFLIQLNNYSQLYSTYDQLVQVIEQKNVTVSGSDIGRDNSVTQIADGLFTIMDVLSIIAILLSVILLIGTMTSLMTEQIQAIGTMKAIGGGRRQIVRHYLTLVAAYATIGTVLGIVIGTLGGYYLAQYLGGLVSLHIRPLQFAPDQVLLSLLVGIGTPLIASLLPIFVGTRITVKQALSEYGVENTTAKNNRIWNGISRFLFVLFPQTVQFGIRNIFRKRLRAVLTITTLAIAGATLFAVQTANYSFNTFLNQVYTVYHFDVDVSLPDPIPQHKFEQVLSSVPGVGHIEGLNQDKATTEWGDAVFTGVQVDTQIYHKDLIAGRWFNNSDQNVVVISQDAADKSGLKIGNTITFTVGRNTAHWQIIGITKDYSGIGPGNLGVILTTLPLMNTFEHFPADYVQQAMIQSTNKAPTQGYLNDLSRRIAQSLSSAGYLPNVQTVQDLIEQTQNKYQILSTMFDIVAIIIAIVGAVGLSNSLAMSVLERRKEIGILRSMGAASRKIAQVFWTEGTFIGLFAWVLAVVLGIPAAYGFIQIQAHVLAPVPFAFDPINLVLILVAILVVTVVATISPTLAAMRIKVVQTLRYE